MVKQKKKLYCFYAFGGLPLQWQLCVVHLLLLPLRFIAANWASNICFDPENLEWLEMWILRLFGEALRWRSIEEQKLSKLDGCKYPSFVFSLPHIPQINRLKFWFNWPTDIDSNGVWIFLAAHAPCWSELR